MAARHAVGIDLGSTNSVISYVDPEAVVSLGAACYGWIRTNGLLVFEVVQSAAGTSASKRPDWPSAEPRDH